MSTKEIANNKKAYFDYEISDTYEAGICLTGTEIKSIRDTGASLNEAYVKVLHQEVWLIGCFIAPYSFGNIHNHEERRDRKLLLHKREIEHLKKVTKEKGFTLLPLNMYFKGGRVKLKIGIGKGRKSYDKRELIKERDEKRSLQRALKNFS
jgi:SsrA-binding protein